MQIKLTVDETGVGERIDKYLGENTEMSRSYISKLAEENCIFVNGKVAKSKTKLKCGDEIDMDVPEPESLEIEKENIPLDIVYEDSDLLIVNKPQGMVVHPAPGNYSGTLVNALMYHCGDSLSGINGVLRPGIVHRIDKDTSGLLLVAKTNVAHIGLAEQIKEHSLTREYIALVHGGFAVDSGTVDAPIGRSDKDRKKMCITDKNSRNAVTHYSILERLGQFTLVRCRLETGRTHQIRVHMASISHPVAGDPVYGVRDLKKEPFKTDGQLLHAATLGFVHPVTGEYIEKNAPLPDYFEKIVEKLRNM